MIFNLDLGISRVVPYYSFEAIYIIFIVKKYNYFSIFNFFALESCKKLAMFTNLHNLKFSSKQCTKSTRYVRSYALATGKQQAILYDNTYYRFICAGFGLRQLIVSYRSLHKPTLACRKACRGMRPHCCALLTSLTDR